MHDFLVRDQLRTAPGRPASCLAPGKEHLEIAYLSGSAGEIPVTEKPDGVQPLLSARTSGKRCTSPIKFASNGEVLSLLHARANVRGMFKSTTDKMTTVSGHRQRAVPRTQPTPKPVATRLRIVASFSPS